MTERILYTWVHLSDIHFGHGGPDWRADQQDVVDKLIVDIRATLDLAEVETPDALLLTGDIAFAGKAEEFAYAKAMIRGIIALTGGSPRIYAVAGNHDVVRTASTNRSEMRLIRDLRNGEEDLAGVLDHPPDRENLEKRFADYREFCESVDSPVAITDAWTDVTTLPNGVILRFVGWNSGLLCQDNDDRGRLRIPIASAFTSLRHRRSNEIVIVLTHHDLNWLQEQDRSNLKGLIWTRDATVHLSGHEHAPDYENSVKTGGRSCIHLSAGAVHADRDRGWAQTENYYNVVTVVETDDGIDLRIYPRRFTIPHREWGVHHDALESGATYAAFPLDTAPVPAAAPASTSADSATPAADGEGADTAPFLERLKRLGRRRTTFPTDLSTEEVVTSSLVVPARSTAGTALLELLDQDTSRSTLILGDPGSGKTILTYELAMHWFGSGLLPIVLDLRDLADRSIDFESLIESGPTVTTTGTFDTASVRIIVDGLDEALATLEPSDILIRMRQLQSLAPVTTLCRSHEYGTRLAPLFEDYFDRIVDLAPWSIADFRDYLQRLHRAELIANLDLVGLVDADPRLQSLVVRPLTARMLTLVATNGGDLPDNVADLYTSYLNRVAEVSDSNLRRFLNRPVSVSMDVWRSVAWQMFRSTDRGIDAFQADRIVRAAEAPELPSDAAFRVIETIMDVDPSGRTVSFLHYSLFEFLVAQHVAEQLVTLAPANPDLAVHILTKDLTHEIRIHVIALLRQATTLNATRWPTYLAEVYGAARDVAPDDWLTACNLVVYIMARLDTDADDALTILLNEESEPFLRNSIQWSLARGDNRSATRDYLAELAADDDEGNLASLNRGYLLYYYGDIDEDAGPPYVDALGPWTNTRQKVTEKMKSEDYDASPSRRLVDAYTFCDMAFVRGEHLTPEEVALIEPLLGSVVADDTTRHSLDLVLTLLNQVRP